MKIPYRYNGTLGRVYLCSISDNIKSDKLNKDKLHNKIRFFLSDFSTQQFSHEFKNEFSLRATKS